MKIKPISVTIVVLAVVTGFLVHEVMNEMTRTAVSAQTVEPKVAIATTWQKPGKSDAPLAVFIGDFSQGSEEGGAGARNWISILAAQVRKVTPLRIAVDNEGEDSGYVLRGHSPTYGEEVRRLVSRDTRMVVISGSRSDVIAPPDRVEAAAEEAYRSVHKLAPQAQLLVIGPTWGGTKPSDEILETRDAVRAAAGEARAHFVDPLQENWFDDGTPGLIGSDGVHPTDLGNQLMAQHIYPLFVRLVSEHS
ncbi:MAG: SGNH/GDSL hydrolase family protein [Mycobacterium sp.]|nr:SGNH/GDSL hydrolase family protein [Mycobacterium sp.]